MIINNQDIKGLPESLAGISIELAPQGTSVENALSEHLTELVLMESGPIGLDIFPVSYRGLMGYSVVIAENSEVCKGLLLHHPTGEIVKFYERFMKRVQEITVPYFKPSY
ncbi:MAG: hypothetical protein J6N51_13475 [Selenomonas sp.]|nr:hypothetical protein [Selenomonas sp.]